MICPFFAAPAISMMDATCTFLCVQLQLWLQVVEKYGLRLVRTKKLFALYAIEV
jgi:hypothetical protein